MRRYHYGKNSYYRKASIYIEHGSWHNFLIEEIVEFICSYLIPRISFPPIPITRDGERTNLKEWYGNLSSWFCVLVHNSILDWCYKRREVSSLKVNYNELKKATYKQDKKWWDEDEERCREYKKEEREEEKKEKPNDSVSRKKRSSRGKV
jgi:hypothetical protein